MVKRQRSVAMKNFLVSSLLLTGASAFPFVLDSPGVDSSLLRNVRRQFPGEGAGAENLCPFNPNHVSKPWGKLGLTKTV